MSDIYEIGIGQLGLSIQEYWEYTPVEILTRNKHYKLHREQEHESLMTHQYINAYLQRMDAKKFPKMDAYRREFIGIKSQIENKKIENKKEVDEIPLEYYIKLACMKGLNPPITIKEVN